MSMSRKDYRVIAEAIAKSLAQTETVDETQRAEALASIALVARNISEQLKADNSAFRYDYFFAACGLDKWGEAAA
jgi:hypothetical protein